MREFVVLGTASQVPTRTRNHNGYLLRWDGEGPSGEEVVRALVSVSTPGLDLRLCPHGGAGAVAPGLEVQPLKHRIETYGYRLQEPDGRSLVPDKLAAAGISGSDVGRLQRDGVLDGVRLDDVSVPRPGQSFAFVMDTAPCAGAEELADGVDLLVAESTFSTDDGELAKQYRHLSAGQAGELAASAAVGTLVLTHFSSRYGDDVTELEEQARGRAVSSTVMAANDLDRIAFPNRRGSPR